MLRVLVPSMQHDHVLAMGYKQHERYKTCISGALFPSRYSRNTDAVSVPEARGIRNLTDKLF